MRMSCYCVFVVVVCVDVCVKKEGTHKKNFCEHFQETSAETKTNQQHILVKGNVFRDAMKTELFSQVPLLFLLRGNKRC